MNRHALIVAVITAPLLGCHPGNQSAPSSMNAATSPSEMSSSRIVPDEYFIGGSIDRGGVYSLAGSRVTLLQAIVSAGGSHGKIAVTVDIIRHTGENPQFMRSISVEEILAGTRPDVILESGDVVNVLPQP